MTRNELIVSTQYVGETSKYRKSRQVKAKGKSCLSTLVQEGVEVLLHSFLFSAQKKTSYIFSRNYMIALPMDSLLPTNFAGTCPHC